MEFVEAMNIIKKVCAAFQGTLQDHQTIQQAVQIVEQGQCRCKEKGEDTQTE